MLDRVSTAPAVLPRRLVRVSVADDLAAIRPAWEGLLARVPCSAYQTPAWLAAWLATRDGAVRPVFGLGHDEAGDLIAVLPLGVTREGGLRVARFLGGRDTNTGLGLFDAAAAMDVRDVLDAVARRAGIDLYVLGQQPADWAGVPNPLLALPHTESPSLQHEADLAADPEIFLRRTLSKRARKHIRQKEARLAERGPVRHLLAATVEDVARVTEALVAQRGARWGSSAANAALDRFLRQVAADPAPVVELHALLCGETVVATFAGACHGRHLSGMVLTFAASPDWARFSPGELLLSRVIAHHCAAGTATFDLGVGEARYKASFCPRAVPLFDTVRGVTWQGRVAAPAWRAALAAKRRLKRSPALWVAVARLRRTLGQRFSERFPGEA